MYFPCIPILQLPHATARAVRLPRPNLPRLRFQRPPSVPTTTTSPLSPHPPHHHSPPRSRRPPSASSTLSHPPVPWAHSPPNQTTMSYLTPFHPDPTRPRSLTCPTRRWSAVPS